MAFKLNEPVRLCRILTSGPVAVLGGISGPIAKCKLTNAQIVGAMRAGHKVEECNPKKPGEWKPLTLDNNGESPFKEAAPKIPPVKPQAPNKVTKSNSTIATKKNPNSVKTGVVVPAFDTVEEKVADPAPSDEHVVTESSSSNHEEDADVTHEAVASEEPETVADNSEDAVEDETLEVSEEVVETNDETSQENDEKKSITIEVQHGSGNNRGGKKSRKSGNQRK